MADKALRKQIATKIESVISKLEKTKSKIQLALDKLESSYQSKSNKTYENKKNQLKEAKVIINRQINKLKNIQTEINTAEDSDGIVVTDIISF